MAIENETKQNNSGFKQSFTSLKGVGGIFENNRKTLLPPVPLAKHKPVDKSTKLRHSDSDVGNETQ